MPFTRPLLVVHSTRPLMSEKFTLPKLLEMVAAPPTEEMSTLPLLSCSVRSPRMLRTSALPNEVVMFAEPASLSVTVPLPPVMVAAPCTWRTVMLPKRLRRSSAPFTSDACTEPLLSLMKVSPEAAGQLDAAERIVQTRGAKIADRRANRGCCRCRICRARHSW